MLQKLSHGAELVWLGERWPSRLVATAAEDRPERIAAIADLLSLADGSLGRVTERQSAASPLSRNLDIVDAAAAWRRPIS